MKKILICILTIVLAMSFVGCGASDKAGEKLAEKAIENAGGGDVDIDGDKMVIKGENGETATFSGGEWPKSDLAKSIPEFKKGKIVTTMELNDSLFISLEGVAEKDFLDYQDKIKQTFTEQSYSMNGDGAISYGAQNTEGLGISLVYTTDEVLSITVGKAQ